MTTYARKLPWQLTPYAIFDMDGTLLDSMGMWDSVDHILLEQRGVTARVGVEEVTKTMTVTESVEYLIDAYALTDTPAQLIDEINALADHAYAHTVPAKEYAAELLEWLRLRGVVMCIATSSEPGQAKIALERLGLDGYFEFILSATEVGCGKSRPDVYLEAARRMGTTPGQCTVFEDAAHAMRTAKEAGFRVVGVYDASSADSIDQSYRFCDCFVDHLGQLMEAE